MSLITYKTRESTGQTAENFNLLFRKKKNEWFSEDGTYCYLNAAHSLVSLKFCLGLLQLSSLLHVPYLLTSNRQHA